MDAIYEAAAKFVALEDCEYRFVVSANRKTHKLKLNFKNSDFFHLAGLHYLTDISIPKNRHETLNNIIFKNKIRESHLKKSRFYNNPKPEKDIKSRIKELKYLEEYLDNDNIIKIYNIRNKKDFYSYIDADYVIESQFKGSSDIVYIFLKVRKENPEYLCVASFFKKDTVSYGGDKLYWMLKAKIKSSKKLILHRHKNYQIEVEDFYVAEEHNLV